MPTDAQRRASRKWYEANKEKQRARERERRGADPDAWLATQRARSARFYERHPGYSTEQSTRWRADNPEKARESARRGMLAWAKRNPEAAALKVRHRRKLGARPTGDALAYARILRHDPCSYCGGPAGTVDHIDPLVTSQNGDWDNLTAACRSCNSRKNRYSLLAALKVNVDMQIGSAPEDGA
jgi:5-methylcytosine-specific restriction endonuclease McrA